MLARNLGAALSPALKQQIIVENYGGAGGTIGTARVARAQPDGYTMLLMHIGIATAPALYRKLPYDTVNDFAGVMPIGSVPSALVIAPSKGIKNLKDFVEKAKAAPGGFTYASAGVGSSTHLTAERFRLSAGFPVVHVPFRGGGFQPEIIAGRVDFGYTPIATSLPNIRDGRLQAIAVSSPRRAAALPDVPTTLEAGYANSDYVIWMGLFFPAKTPRPIVEKLNLEMRRAWENPALRERFTGLDVTSMPMTPAEFDALIKKEIADNAVLVKAAGLKPN